MSDAEHTETCAVSGCDNAVAADVPAIMARELLDAPAAELVGLCSVHAEQADAPERPTN
jgi:hypothetical protein